jgi:tRNA(Ile)-lysidine synthase
MMPLDLSVALKHLPQARIAVACSGGLDSIALLYAACAAGLQPIALHIDHGIHPESAVWASQLEQTCAQYGAAFASERLAELASDMPSLENAARNARYAALARLCEQYGVDTLLLAHHANDQAETVLLNLLRGSGLSGIGMPAVRQMGSVQLHRPWLNVSRREIAAYAAQHALRWIEDPSNLDETIRRNAMRHTVWPVLEGVEPRALSSVLRFAQLAHAAASTETALVNTCLQPHLLVNNAANNNEYGITEQGIDWRTAAKPHTAAVQATLLRGWLAHIGCRAPTQARLYAMLAQLNAQTGDGLRCSHGGYDFVYRERRLWATVHNRT